MMPTCDYVACDEVATFLGPNEVPAACNEHLAKLKVRIAKHEQRVNPTPSTPPIEDSIEDKLDNLATYLVGYGWSAYSSQDPNGFADCIKEKVLALIESTRQDPFDFVEPCEENCSKERHAYHQGQWDLATKMSERAGLQPKEPKEDM